MKLVMTLLVRDEADILRENIEFHLSHGVDMIIATDNLSVDATKDILMEYQNQGLLEYIFESRDNYHQSEWVTRMARLAKTKHDADWVINSDADEFWWPETAGSLKQVFEQIPENIDGINIERYNFVPIISQNQPFYHSMIFREVKSFNHSGNLLPPKTCHRGNENIHIRQGNHIIRFENNKKPEIQKSQAISILHFPVRTKEQMTNKIIKGGRAYKRSGLNLRIGSAWRDLYAKYQQDGLVEYFEEIFYFSQRVTTELEDRILVEDTRLREDLNRIFTKRR